MLQRPDLASFGINEDFFLTQWGSDSFPGFGAHN